MTMESSLQAVLRFVLLSALLLGAAAYHDTRGLSSPLLAGGKQQAKGVQLLELYGGNLFDYNFLVESGVLAEDKLPSARFLKHDETPLQWKGEKEEGSENDELLHAQSDISFASLIDGGIDHVRRVPADQLSPRRVVHNFRSAVDLNTGRSYHTYDVGSEGDAAFPPHGHYVANVTYLYNATLASNVVSLDVLRDYEVVTSVLCDFNNTSPMYGEMHVTTSSLSHYTSLVRGLRRGMVLVGDAAWGCHADTASMSAGGPSTIIPPDHVDALFGASFVPLYREILGVKAVSASTRTVTLSTAGRLFTDLFDHLSLDIDVAPIEEEHEAMLANITHARRQNSTADANAELARFEGGAGGGAYTNMNGSSATPIVAESVYLFDDVIYNDDFLNYKASQTLWSYGLNYDTSTELVNRSSIPIVTSTIATLTCEDCYATASLAFQFGIDIDVFKIDRMYFGLSAATKANFYLMGETTATGSISKSIDLVTAKEGSSFTLYISILPIIVKPSLSLSLMMTGTVTGLQATMMTGAYASGTATAGLKYTDASGFDVIRSNDLTYTSTPLSLGITTKGTIDLRMYLVPKLTMSLYGFLPIYAKLYPYVGALITPAGTAIGSSSDPGTSLSISTMALPTIASTPSLQYYSGNNIVLTMPTVTSTGTIIDHEVTLTVSGTATVLTPLGYFTYYGVYTFTADTYLLVSTSYTLIADCARNCMYTTSTCVSFTWSSSTKDCKLYSIASTGTIVTSTSGTVMYTLVSAAKTTYMIRNGDPIETLTSVSGTVSTPATTANTLSLSITSSLSASVSLRAANYKGYSTASTLTLVPPEVTSVSLSFSGLTATVSYTTNFVPLTTASASTVKIYTYGTLYDTAVKSATFTAAASLSTSFTYTITATFDLWNKDLTASVTLPITSGVYASEVKASYIDAFISSSMSFTYQAGSTSYISFPVTNSAAVSSVGFEYKTSAFFSYGSVTLSAMTCSSTRCKLTMARTYSNSDYNHVIITAAGTGGTRTFTNSISEAASYSYVSFNAGTVTRRLSATNMTSADAMTSAIEMTSAVEMVDVVVEDDVDVDGGGGVQEGDGEVTIIYFEPLPSLSDAPVTDMPVLVTVQPLATSPTTTTTTTSHVPSSSFRTGMTRRTTNAKLSHPTSTDRMLTPGMLTPASPIMTHASTTSNTSIAVFGEASAHHRGLLSYTANAWCATGDTTGLNYQLYYGVAIAVGFDAIQIPFPTGIDLSLSVSGWKSYKIASAYETAMITIISPTFFPSTWPYTWGCFRFSPMPAFIKVRSPTTGDSWGVASTWHTVEFSYYSISSSASVTVSFIKVSDGSTAYTVGSVPIEPPSVRFSMPSANFAAGSTYMAKVVYSSTGNSDVIGYSNTFTAVAVEVDNNAITRASISSYTFDAAVSFPAATIVSRSGVTVSTSTGSTCKVKYITTPYVLLCDVVVALKSTTTGSLLYNATVRMGGSVDVSASDSSATLPMDLFYAAYLPAFTAPSIASLGTLYKKMVAGTQLTSSKAFPPDYSSGGVISYKQYTATFNTAYCLTDYAQKLVDVGSTMAEMAESFLNVR
jgi:hypothetical protein